MYKFIYPPDFLFTLGMELTLQTAVGVGALEEMGEEKQVKGIFQVGCLSAWLPRHRQGGADHTCAPPTVEQRQE